MATLDTVRFLRRNTDESTVVEPTPAEDASDAKAHTAGKGRPTPKRREAEGRRRGPVPPPPRTTREALRRNRGSKEERKELAAKRKEMRLRQRQRMMAGDEKMLPARERGPVKAYVRDLIDSRRNLLGHFLRRDDDTAIDNWRPDSGIDKLVCDEREAVLIRALEEIYRERHAESINVAIVYGAGHALPVVAYLKAALGYVVTSAEWVQVFAY